MIYLNWLTETIPAYWSRLRSRIGHCTGSIPGHKWGRGLRCNCRRCPGSAGGPDPRLRQCRACRKESFLG